MQALELKARTPLSRPVCPIANPSEDNSTGRTHIVFVSDAFEPGQEGFVGLAAWGIRAMRNDILRRRDPKSVTDPFNPRHVDVLTTLGNGDFRCTPQEPCDPTCHPLTLANQARDHGRLTER